MTNEEPMGQQQQQVTFQDGTASSSAPQDANTLVTPTAVTSASDFASSKKLSVISKAYDRDNKGYLDQTEQKMREMDDSGRGHVPNGVVYDLMQESGAFPFVSNQCFAPFVSFVCSLLCVCRVYRRKPNKGPTKAFYSSHFYIASHIQC